MNTFKQQPVQDWEKNKGPPAYLYLFLFTLMRVWAPVTDCFTLDSYRPLTVALLSLLPLAHFPYKWPLLSSDRKQIILVTSNSPLTDSCEVHVDNISLSFPLEPVRCLLTQRSSATNSALPLNLICFHWNHTGRPAKLGWNERCWNLSSPPPPAPRSHLVQILTQF